MKKSIYVSLFAAFIAVGSFIQIPLPLGVPIVIQDMMAILTGFLLGPVLSCLSVLIFLILGIIGLPVFTGKAGLQVIINGLTGGFLVGYLVAALIAGFFALLLDKVSKNHKILPWIIAFFGTVFAFASIFILGLYQFAKVGEVSLSKAFVASVLPYLPGTIIKILVIIPLAKRFRPIIRNYLY